MINLMTELSKGPTDNTQKHYLHGKPSHPFISKNISEPVWAGFLFTRQTYFLTTQIQEYKAL